ncbi:PIG-L family deacetylase [Archangium gephyra]|uniref:PIG-L deacetylase family protein n=1 Tax=Archangium gephyra TaxID=48 RepID=UPI0035D3F3D4
MRGASLVRTALRRFNRFALRHLARPLLEVELRRPAMVFAPHPDDETLGCGGTILRKRRTGAAVHLAFLTDGSASHAGLMPRAELTALRVDEALAAAEALGVPAGDVFLLGLPDGALHAHHEEAVARVTALLERHRPEQLFLPSIRAEHPDHVAANAIVHEAVRRWGRVATLFEYPVWLWRHWPAVPLPGTRAQARAVLVSSLRAGFGFRLLSEFRTSVPIRDCVDQKRRALARHASQMRRRDGDPRWWTLDDVSEGEFLDCFFQEQEVFRRIELVAPRVDPGRR